MIASRYHLAADLVLYVNPFDDDSSNPNEGEG